MKSKAMCLGGIFEALRVANPDQKDWITDTEIQRSFLKMYATGVMTDLPILREYLEAFATSDAAAMNKWFADHGFPGMNVRGEFIIGTIFDLLVDWLEPGKKRDLYMREMGWYEGVQMTPNSGMRAWKLLGHSYPLFELETRQDGWKVFLCETEPKCTDLDLAEQAMRLLKLERTPCEVNKLYFPAVEMQMDVDISFMTGMEIENGFRIDEALKKIKLRLDDKGARAQSAVALMRRGLEMGVYTIDKPFFIIFWKAGLNFPAFVAIATPEHWKRKNS